MWAQLPSSKNGEWSPQLLMPGRHPIVGTAFSVHLCLALGHLARTAEHCSLASRYEMSDLGEIQSYLSVEIIRDHPNKTLEINQTVYSGG